MNISNVLKKGFPVLVCVLLVFTFLLKQADAQTKIGVLFAVHGGNDLNRTQYQWDAGVQQFSYDPNHPVYKIVIWNPALWSLVLSTEQPIKFIRKFDFEYPRIGDVDPFRAHTELQVAAMESALEPNPYNIDFIVDWMGWLCGDCWDHLPYPRFIYHGPDGPGVGTDCTYCGEAETEDVVLQFDGGEEVFTLGGTLTGQTSTATAVIDEVTVTSGSWVGNDAAGYLSLSAVSGTFEDNETIVDDATPGSATAVGTTTWLECDPDRYDVDGPVERLLAAGVERIIIVDLTVGGVRFSKTYEAVEMAKRAIDDWNDAHATSIPHPLWVNDYSTLMERSFPTEPAGWTRTIGLEWNHDSNPATPPVPITNPHELKNGSPNPVVADPLMADLNVDAIESSMSGTVTDAATGVLLLNHAIHDNNEVFDLKMDDTVVLNNNIKAELLARHSTMDPLNIVGARLGIREENPENGLVERTREMRGEDLGHQWLYESDKKPPSNGGYPWGYLAWDALEYLKDRGVQHIVVGFPQISTHTVLDLVEIPNQIGREIGIKTWAKWGTGDYATYPPAGYPFADYWGIWVNTECDGEPCCFTMGGCGVGGDYPPPRQTPLTTKRDDFDPSLAYDLSDYGHLGYDPGIGAPNPGAPVQDQYTGTWEMYDPPSDTAASEVGQFLANHVIAAAACPMVYITNGDTVSIDAGESVTWEAHLVTGTPSYTYEWATNKNDTGWSIVSGETGATWIWIPGSGDEGVYDVRCKVTDSSTCTDPGEVIWEEFAVGDSDDDGVQDAEDNCPNHANGPNRGTCTQFDGVNWIVSTKQFCTVDADCDPGEICEKIQADNYPPSGNGIGDACDCESDFLCDGDVDSDDVTAFLDDFGREPSYRRCGHPTWGVCDGDFNCDVDVDADDVTKFIEDFGREASFKPCPPCTSGAWCSYP